MPHLYRPDDRRTRRSTAVEYIKNPRIPASSGEHSHLAVAGTLDGDELVTVALIRSAAAGLALLTVAGSQMDAALSRRWVDVNFRPGTSVGQVLRIRAVCSHVPNVTADPVSRNLPALDVVHSVRFNTTRASDANVAERDTCLAKLRAAVGVNAQDASDGGG